MNSVKNHENLNLLKISWIRSSMVLGLILLAIGIATILVLKILDISKLQIFSDTKNFVEKYGLLGVFMATIIAGTIIPLGSPALVVAAASFGINPLPLALVATVGFTLGMSINYFFSLPFWETIHYEKNGSRKWRKPQFYGVNGVGFYTFYLGLFPFYP
ncbi:MAG: hypothetical protein ACUVTE_01490 [Candidatus Bathycorpusculaceae bacterium]